MENELFKRFITLIGDVFFYYYIYIIAVIIFLGALLTSIIVGFYKRKNGDGSGKKKYISPKISAFILVLMSAVILAPIISILFYG